MANHFHKTDDLITKIKSFNRKKDLLGESVCFRDGVKWIHVEEYGFYCFKESYDPNTPFKKDNIKHYVNQDVGVGNISISQLSLKTGKLFKEKKENLKNQLPFISEEYRWFYNMLINE